ncbi:13449_t:CDS:2 [Funneliformis geosporum]|uniref:Tryptophan--tRNA ligase, mitochondrial n=1 Tax=Funneliformis geosporum TaxID=1117311 RepID=A0A9W4SEK1_9GLOM|nr:13449_t:CDS:2 [Funneliformis geosporum]
MSAYSEEVLISKLNKLVDTQESISLLSQWFMYHRRHVATSVDIWNRELRKASSARKVSFIYLCNDVCQNSRRKGPEFVREFRKVLPDAIEHTYRHATADVQNKIRRVVNIWEEREVFDKDFLDELRRNFLGTNSPQSGSSMAKRQIDKQTKAGTSMSPPPGRSDIAKLVTTTHTIVDLETVIQEYGRKVAKLWTEIMEAEEKPGPSILSQQLDYLLRVLIEQKNLITRNISNRTQFIIQMKEIIAQEEMKLRIDNKTLLDTQSKINEAKECSEQLKAITEFPTITIMDEHNKQQQQTQRIPEIKREESTENNNSFYDPTAHLILPPTSFAADILPPSETQLFGDSLINNFLQLPYQPTSISSSISNSPAPSNTSDEHSDPLRNYVGTTRDDGKKKTPVHQKITFSGIQPTGIPHLGNYLGAIKNWISLQKHKSESELILYSIVDLHALTIPRDAKLLQQSKMEMTIILMACGIDPKKCLIFEQSKVSAHSELSWILSCVTPIGWLSRMTQWKNKIQEQKNVQSTESIDITREMDLGLFGLFAYPVLQAADILLYKSTHVPVGDDQIQHLEFTRDLAEKFNKLYKRNVFPLPQTILDPLKKMSKSNPLEHSRINLTDSPENISQKIKRATTDSQEGISYSPDTRPGISNLINIYSSFTGLTIEQVVNEYKNSDNKKFKESVVDVIVQNLQPIQKEIEKLKKEEGYVNYILEDGSNKANEIAKRNLEEISKVIGLRN